MQEPDPNLVASLLTDAGLPADPAMVEFATSWWRGLNAELPTFDRMRAPEARILDMLGGVQDNPEALVRQTVVGSSPWTWCSASA